MGSRVVRGVIATLLAAALACCGCGGGSSAPEAPVDFDVGDNDRSVVAAFGESLTAGEGSSGGGYRAELDRLLAAAGRQGLRVVNEGVTGSSSSHGASRVGEVLRRRRPAVLLLLYGASDPAITDLQPPLDSHSPPLAVNLRAIVEAARANRTLVVVSTLPPVCGSGRLYQRERTAVANDTIRALALELGAGDLGVVLVDPWRDFLAAAPPDGCGLLGPSGNLPTDAGYAALAASFAGGLDDLAW